jgi:predicted TIM-barrel fold metal-dependent hydrolase
VGHADLTRGAAAGAVLDAHLAAGNGRFRGIRHSATWDPDPEMLNPAYSPPEDMLDSPGFRAGFAELARRGLSFEAWLYFHQIPRLTRLAQDFPTVPIVLNHCGGVLGIRGYANRRDEVFAQWSANMRALAACPNVVVKCGGLGMRLPGFGFENGETAPSSQMLVDAWRPWMDPIIEMFGTKRCMFESNFPVDKGGFGYAVGWNAFKRLAAGASAEEKDNLFRGTAARIYRIDA